VSLCRQGELSCCSPAGGYRKLEAKRLLLSNASPLALLVARVTPA